ncbi:MAG: hypothetical protein M3R38_33050 [Actinomycetota bacterium]|nr:hypothetical protein [Actinomycetota bacterium]MDP9486421.1 hypothetical protein [Actinomycetota bacterium]
MSREAKRREVVQLLKDYRAWHSPFGGASPTDSTLNLETQGSYGPAGLIQAGQAFDREGRRLYAESYAALEHALTLLKGKHFESWLVLLAPYLGDPGDPSLVTRWRDKHRAWEAGREVARKKRRAWEEKRDKIRKKGTERTQGWEEENPEPERIEEWAREHPEPQLVHRHDEAVGRLAGYLATTDLYVVFPKRMTSREETQVERRNDEFFALYQKFRADRMGKTKAVETAAEMCGYGATRAWEIVKLREGKAS